MEKVLTAKEKELKAANKLVQKQDAELTDLKARLNEMLEDQRKQEQVVQVLREEIEKFKARELHYTIYKCVERHNVSLVRGSKEAQKEFEEKVEQLKIRKKNEVKEVARPELQKLKDGGKIQDAKKSEEPKVSMGSVAKVEKKPEKAPEPKGKPISVEDRRRNRRQQRRAKRKPQRGGDDKEVSLLKQEDKEEHSIERICTNAKETQPTTQRNEDKPHNSTKDWALLVENEVRALKSKLVENEAAFQLNFREQEETRRKIISYFNILFKKVEKGRKKWGSGETTAIYYFKVDAEFKKALRDLKMECSKKKVNPQSSMETTSIAAGGGVETDTTTVKKKIDSVD